MASKKSTNISLLVLGGASALTIAYLIWLYLAPSVAVPPVERVITVNLDTGVVASTAFQTLLPFASLPVPVGTVGRPNPFSDFAPTSIPPQTNENVNAAPVIPVPPPVNSPENSNLNGNTP